MKLKKNIAADIRRKKISSLKITCLYKTFAVKQNVALLILCTANYSVTPLCWDINVFRVTEFVHVHRKNLNISKNSYDTPSSSSLEPENQKLSATFAKLRFVLLRFQPKSQQFSSTTSSTSLLYQLATNQFQMI